MMNMTPEEKLAYEWALSNSFQSVSASYARTLAKYIERQESSSLEAIQTIVARMRRDLEKIGGFENRFISVPAGGVQHYIEELEKAINVDGLSTPLHYVPRSKPRINLEDEMISNVRFLDRALSDDEVLVYSRVMQIPGDKGFFKSACENAYTEAADKMLKAGLPPDEIVELLDRLYWTTADCYGG